MDSNHINDVIHDLDDDTVGHSTQALLADKTIFDNVVKSIQLFS